jgi:ATPase subunit of ABC transporter with duplicated ATPase domains
MHDDNRRLLRALDLRVDPDQDGTADLNDTSILVSHDFDLLDAEAAQEYEELISGFVKGLQRVRARYMRRAYVTRMADLERREAAKDPSRR